MLSLGRLASDLLLAPMLLESIEICSGLLFVLYVSFVCSFFSPYSDESKSLDSIGLSVENPYSGAISLSLTYYFETIESLSAL